MPARQTLPAILLAAGLSTRMRAFKPLLPLHGTPLLHHAIHALTLSNAIGPILVVTGHNAARVQSAVDGLPVTLVHNPRYAEGEMLSSLLAGISALPQDAPGFLLAFGDQPAVSTDTIRRLVDHFHNALPRPPLVLPIYLGKRGHPVVLSYSLVSEIRALRSEETLKSVVHRHLAEAALLPTDDAAVLEDLDTPEDFARAEQTFSAPRFSVSPVSPLNASNGDSHA